MIMPFSRSTSFLMMSLFCLMQSVLIAEEQNTPDDQTKQVAILDLSTALERAWACSPTLEIANNEVCVKSAEEYQTRAFPNPEAAVEIDGPDSFFGNRGRNCDHEIYYSVSQLIELGGKRSARQREAAFRTSISKWEREAVKLDLSNAVTKAIIDVAAAQEYVRLTKEQQKIAQEVLSTVSTKAQAGKVTPLQTKKAEIAHATASLALDKAQRALEYSRKNVSALWGCIETDFSEVNYPLSAVHSIPDLAYLKANNSNPDLLKWDVAIAIAEEMINLQKAERIPDVVVTAGYVTGCGSDDSWTVGLSMPIPIFDQNQGNISKARYQLAQILNSQQESIIKTNIALTSTYNEFLSAYHEALTFQETILASATDAFNAASEGYSQGKYDYLELLDAQRTLFEMQVQYINSLVEYHYKKADVQRLVGINQPLETCLDTQ